MTAVIIYFTAVTLTSCLTYLVYGFDKLRAENGGRRIPEQTLHLLAMVGGWPGAWLGQKQFRHKTQKTAFLAVFWLTVVAHILVVATVTYTLA